MSGKVGRPSFAAAWLARGGRGGVEVCLLSIPGNVRARHTLLPRSPRGVYSGCAVWMRRALGTRLSCRPLTAAVKGMAPACMRQPQREPQRSVLLFVPPTLDGLSASSL